MRSRRRACRPCVLDPLPPENPAINMVYRGAPWETFMRDGIKRLMDCDILALLPAGSSLAGRTSSAVWLSLSACASSTPRRSLRPTSSASAAQSSSHAAQYRATTIRLCVAASPACRHTSPGGTTGNRTPALSGSRRSPTSLPAESVWTCSRSPRKPFPRAALLRKRHAHPQPDRAVPGRRGWPATCRGQRPPRLGALLSSPQLRQLARQLNEIANDADQGASGEHCYTAPPYGACPSCHSTKAPQSAA